MYTQCPDCATSFRVSAEVLKQAAGKVRCGGCGNAFNALEYLSEAKPESKTAPEPKEALPELKPDPYEDAPEQAPPAAISPEQSAALLKTLDELAGDDIRLEDTGIEWRVMGEEEDAGQSQVDEVLDASPTPVDQFLTKTPNEVEASEVFDEPEAVASDIELIGAAEEAGGEELRFDDNTGLPDDFDFEAAQEPTPAAPPPQPQAAAPEPHPQVDLALGDPDEWGELLSEAVIEPEPTPDDGPSIIEELEALEAEISAETAEEPPAAEEPADREAPLDIDTQFDLQAEALGLDFSGVHEAAEPAEEPEEAKPVAEVAEEAPPEPDPTETSIEDDLIAAAFEAEQAAAAALEASGIQLSLDDQDDEESIIDDLSALDDEVKAEAAEDPKVEDHEPSIADELAALDEPAEDHDPFADDEPSIADELIGRDAVYSEEKTETEQDFPESTGALEFELAEAAAAAEKSEVAEAAAEAAAEEAEAEASEEDAEADDIAALIAEEHEQAEPADAETDDIAAELALLDDEEVAEQSEEPVDEEAALTEDLAEAAEAAGYDIPPQSEEEQTINAMIDQDLMRLAIEDEEGFASTVVFEKQSKSGKRIEADVIAAKADEAPEIDEPEDVVAEIAEAPADEEDSVETIIMEGSFARTAEEQERIEEALDEETGKPAFLAAAEAENARGSGGSIGRRVAMIGGAIVLLLGLGGQFVHQSRAELATVPAINNVIGPIYRSLGMPITPEWDVSGWRFEVTRDITSDLSPEADEALTGTDALAEGEATEEEIAEASGPETLTIYSRMANQSSQPLPYPLVSVSLTDRFEETIGNVVVEPADYLTGDFDPRRLVPVGETFDAVISIESPSMEAIGFKLYVCYRQAGDLLRCGMEDFK